MSLRNLLVSFGIEVNGQEKLDKVDKSLDSLVDKFKLLGEAVSAAFIFKGLTNFITDTIELGRNLRQQSELLGVNVDELERYRYAASMAGLDTKEADRALLLFNRTLGQAQKGGKDAQKELAMVGASMFDAQGHTLPLDEVLARVADKFAKTTDRATKTQLAVRLFGKSGATMIPLMDEGAEGLRKYSEEFTKLGGGIGEGFAKQAEEASQAIRRMTFAWTVLKTRIVGAVMPSVEKIIWGITEIVMGLQKLHKETYFAQTALIALAVAGAAAFAPFLLEVLPLLAAFGAMYLLFDDIYTLFAGGDSLIGRFIDKLFGIGASKVFVEDIKKAFQAFLEYVNEYGIPAIQWLVDNLPKAFQASLPWIKAVIYAVEDMVKMVVHSWQALGHLLHAAGQFTAGDIKGANVSLDAAGKEVDATGAALNDDHKQRDLQGETEEWMRKIGAHRPVARLGYGPYRDFDSRQRDTFDATEGAGFREPGQVHIVQHINAPITVQGAADPNATGRSVSDELNNKSSDQVRRALGVIPVTP